MGSSPSLYLLGDVGSTFTKLCLVDAGAPAVLASAAAPTTVGTDVNAGFDAALGRLGPRAREAGRILVSSSAAGGLRIAAVGLVPELTMKAARIAALGAGGKVVGAFSFRLTAQDLAGLRELRPDMILLAGGTDGGDTEHIIHNAGALAAGLPGVPVVAAGNREAREELERIFAGRPEVRFAANVMPEVRRLDLDPARACIRELFLERIVAAKGLDRLRSRAEVVRPTPEAVLRAVALLSRGHGGSPGLGELLAVDVGGATTDVYSCAEGRPSSPAVVLRGLPEPFEKRTVEADIGMRHTIAHLLEQCDVEEVARAARATADEVRAWAGAVAGDPGHLPASEREHRIDAALAAAGCRLAVARHCGWLEECYTPEGRVYVQEGKDLGPVRCVVGSGGPLAAGGPRAGEVLAGARRAPGESRLLPSAPEFLIDRRYLLWAMGLLADHEPAAALELMKRHLEPC